MIPLALLSLVSIYIFFERWAALRKAATEDATFMKRIKDYIHDGEIESAEMLCKKTDTPYARLIQKGISRISRTKCFACCRGYSCGTIRDIARTPQTVLRFAVPKTGAKD